MSIFFFFFNDTATTEIYTLSLHDALPISLGAALDLERVHADLHQALHMLHGAEVLGVHDVGAVLVFHDGHQLAGAALFLQQVDLLGLGVARAVAAGAGELAVGLLAGLLEAEVLLHGLGQGLAGIGIHGRVMRLVVPAAGIGAGALVGIAPVEVARQQAAARVGDAQRAVHEDLDLHVDRKSTRLNS